MQGKWGLDKAVGKIPIGTVSVAVWYRTDQMLQKPKITHTTLLFISVPNGGEDRKDSSVSRLLHCPSAP